MYYTLRQAAERIGIQVRTAREWLKKGKLIAEQNEYNHRWRVSEKEVQRLRLEKNGNED